MIRWRWIKKQKYLIKQTQKGLSTGNITACDNNTWQSRQRNKELKYTVHREQAKRLTEGMIKLISIATHGSGTHEQRQQEIMSPR